MPGLPIDPSRLEASVQRATQPQPGQKSIPQQMGDGLQALWNFDSGDVTGPASQWIGEHVPVVGGAVDVAGKAAGAVASGYNTAWDAIGRTAWEATKPDGVPAWEQAKPEDKQSFMAVIGGATMTPELLAQPAGAQALAAAKLTGPGSALAGRASALSQASTRMAWRGMSALAAAGSKLPHSDLAVNHFLPGWVKISDKLDQDFALARSTARLRSSSTPLDVSEEAVKDALKIPPAENVALRAKGGKPGETITPLEQLPSGELRQQVSALNARDRRALFDKAGVSNLQELEDVVREGTLNSDQVKWISKNWGKLFSQDLYRIDQLDQSLRSPHALLDQVEAARQPDAQRFLAGTHALIAEAMTGPYHTDQAVIGSYLRSLFGLQRGTVRRHADWLRTRGQLLGKSTTGELRTAAMEGDQKAYDQLSAHEKMVVDSERWLYAVLRDLRRQNGKVETSTNYYPRRFLRDPKAPRAAGGKPRPMASTVTAHREENLTFETPEQTAQRQAMLQQERESLQEQRKGLNPETDKKAIAGIDRKVKQLDQQLRFTGPHMALTQRFPTVHDANRALLDERDAYVRDHLSEAQQQGPLDPAIRKDLEARLRTESEEAYPLMEANADRVVPGDLLKAIQSAHTDMAIRDLQGAIIEDRGMQLQVAYSGPQSRESEQFIKNRGYRHLKSGAHSEVRWHPQAAQLLDRYQEIVSGGGSKMQRGLRAIERAAIKNIMYSPFIHGWNIAGRMGWGFFSHPALMTDQVVKSLGGTALSAEQRAREAYNAGFLPQLSFKKAGAEFYEGYGVGTGDSEAASVPGLNDLGGAPEHVKASPSARALGLGKAATGWWGSFNNAFWAKYNQFGVMMYHVEKQAALKSGIPEAQARLWAADRANAWIGQVRPEQWTRHANDLSRHLLFAPNWWRTFGALMTGHYDKTGLLRTPGLRNFVVQNEVKSLMAAFAFQKVTGNALNLALAGHFQWENQPGNQDRVEMDRFFPIDPKTGAHMTMEDPVSRQLYALEKAGGLEGPESQAGGTKGYHLEDVPAAMATTAASRLSPLVNALAAAANIDVYQSAQKGELYRVNPSDGAFDPFGPQLLAALSQLTPFSLMRAVESAPSQPGTPQEPLLPGWSNTTVPKNVRDAIGASAERMLTGLLGINPPYPYAEKARGKGAGQDELQKVADAKTNYDGELQTLSREMYDGTLTPAQVVQRYHDLSTAYHGFLNHTFQGAPYYKNGQLGLLHDWEDIYRQATGADGQLDWIKVDDLQQKFTQEHTGAEMAALHGAISNAEVKAPFLQLYHKTIDQYRQFQQETASTVGLSLSDLRAQTAEYGALYGDRRASAQYLFGHPQLADYERQKRAWEGSTTAGLLYGLFYSTGTVMRWLQNHGMTQEQLITQLSGEEGVSAPA